MDSASGEPACDWCGTTIPISRAHARLIRVTWGPLWCEECSPVNHYGVAIRDIEDGVNQGAGTNGPQNV